MNNVDIKHFYIDYFIRLPKLKQNKECISAISNFTQYIYVCDQEGFRGSTEAEWFVYAGGMR